MNITKTNINDLNVIISVKISKEDYQEKVDEILKKYRKSAKVNGFRKGHIPMGLVRKQYGKAVMIEEINRLLQENISKYISNQQLNLIGSPLPKPSAIDWNAEVLSFEFEVGLAPDFEIDLSKQKVLRYEILSSPQDIDRYIEDMSNIHGETTPQDEVMEESIVTVSISESKENSDKEEKIVIADIKSPDNRSKLIGAKPKDVLLLEAKDLAMEDVILNRFIKQEGEKLSDVNLSLEIREIYYKKPHPINQELFDKILGKDIVDSEESFREKITQDFEKNYCKQSDQYFFHSVIQVLTEQIKFNLPKDFLIRLAMESHKGEEKTKEVLEEEYKNTELFLRDHLIKSKLKDDYKITISEEEIKQQILNSIKSYIAMYNLPVDQNRVSELSKNFLKDEKQRKQAEDKILIDKLTEVFKEKVKTELKQVSLDEFLKVTQENKDIENTE